MSERRRTPNHSIPALFIFLLLGIFAVFSLVLIVLGAQAYHNTVEHTNDHNRERVLASYVRNNLRANDVAGGITFESDGECPRLVLRDPEDEEYVKYIYVYEGQLCELYTEADKAFNPEAGEEICAADSIGARTVNGCIEVTVTADGTEHVTVFALRGGEDRI